MRQFVFAAVRRGCGGGRLDQRDQTVDAGLDAASEVAFLKEGDDLFADDPAGLHVGDGAFQPVADFDAQRTVILRNHQQHAVIDTLAAQLPLLESTHRVVLDAVLASGGNQQYGDLRALALLQAGELAFQLRALPGIEGLGEVGDAGAERRNGDRRRLQHDRPAQQQGGQQPARQGHCAGCAGALPKSTLGAVEMAASFSTLKLALGL